MHWTVSAGNETFLFRSFAYCKYCHINHLGVLDEWGDPHGVGSRGEHFRAVHYVQQGAIWVRLYVSSCGQVKMLVDLDDPYYGLRNGFVKIHLQRATEIAGKNLGPRLVVTGCRRWCRRGEGGGGGGRTSLAVLQEGTYSPLANNRPGCIRKTMPFRAGIVMTDRL